MVKPINVSSLILFLSLMYLNMVYCFLDRRPIGHRSQNFSAEEMDFLVGEVKVLEENHLWEYKSSTEAP